MALTYTNIATTTLTGSQATVTFSSIPATYTDLLVRISARSVRGLQQDDCQMYFNASNSNNNAGVFYSLGNNNAAYSSFPHWTAQPANNSGSNIFSSAEFYIHSYSSSGKFRPVGSIGTAPNNTSTVTYAWQSFGGGVWMQTTVINSVSVFAGDQFAAGTVISLYGILRA